MKQVYGGLTLDQALELIHIKDMELAKLRSHLKRVPDVSSIISTDRGALLDSELLRKLDEQIKNSTRNPDRSEHAD